MSNKTTLQTNNSTISTHNTDLSAILERVNNLPTSDGGITPTGTLDITENGTYDVTEYASANVNVASAIEIIENIFSNDYSQIGYSGSYITSDGYTLTDVLWSDLTPYTGQSATWYVTNPIEIKSDTWYKYESFSSGNNPGCCFLGEDEVTIYNGFVYKGEGKFHTPENAKYIVMSVAKANLETMVVKEMTETEIKEMEIDALIDRTLSGDYVNNRIKSIGSEGLRATQITSLHCENVASVGGEGVRQCNYLTNVYLPKCTNLGSYSFGICPLLERVELGAMTNIRAYDFYNCTKLTTLIINNTTAVCSLANVSAFTGSGIASGTGYIYVPDTLLTQYQQATNWSTYASQIKGTSELGG